MRGSSQYQPQGLAAAYEGFLRRFPAYAATTAVDDLRATDYARLDRFGHTYLDYTGGGLYAESQIRRHQELLHERVLGNPHSQSPASLASAELAKESREAVRRFFNAPEDEFEIVFTPNASGALKLVGEAYPRDPAAAITLRQCQRRIEDKTGKVPNTIRVSLGLASNFADVHRFLAFAESYRDRVAE